MKTVEEMRVAVLAECETVCPKCYKAVYKDGIRFYSNRKGTVEIYNETYLRAIDVSENMGEGLLIAAYRLLGLAERDAVADEKARLLKRYRARIKRLRADDAETHRIQMEVKDERIAELQTRNAALVAALEIVKYGCEFGNQSLGCQKLPDGKGYSAVIGSPYEFVCDALQAYKKGGANG